MSRVFYSWNVIKVVPRIASRSGTWLAFEIPNQFHAYTIYACQVDSEIIGPYYLYTEINTEPHDVCPRLDNFQSVTAYFLVTLVWVTMNTTLYYISY